MLVLKQQVYVGFSLLSQDVELFTNIFEEKHPECGVGNDDDTTNVNTRSLRNVIMKDVNKLTHKKIYIP